MAWPVNRRLIGSQTESLHPANQCLRSVIYQVSAYRHMRSMSDKMLEDVRRIIKALDIPIEVLDGFEIQKLTATSQNTLLETYEKVVEGEKLQDCIVVVVAPLQFAGRNFPLLIRCYCDSKGKFQVTKAMLMDDIMISTADAEHPQEESKLSHETEFALATLSTLLGNVLATVLLHALVH